MSNKFSRSFKEKHSVSAFYRQWCTDRKHKLYSLEIRGGNIPGHNQDRQNILGRVNGCNMAHMVQNEGEPATGPGSRREMDKNIGGIVTKRFCFLWENVYTRTYV